MTPEMFERLNNHLGWIQLNTWAIAALLAIVLMVLIGKKGMKR